MTTENLNVDELISGPVNKKSYTTPLMKQLGNIQELVKSGSGPGIEGNNDDITGPDAPMS